MATLTYESPATGEQLEARGDLVRRRRVNCLCGTAHFVKVFRCDRLKTGGRPVALGGQFLVTAPEILCSELPQVTVSSAGI